MSEIQSTRSRISCALLGFLLLFVTRSASQAQLTGPSPNDGPVAVKVVELLEIYHLRQQTLDNKISGQFFDAFLEDFDPAKMYFEKRDIDEFSPYRTYLDDSISTGDLSFAYMVHKRFLQRAKQRLALVDELLAAAHDFTRDEYLSIDYDNMDYAATADELRQRWRKRVKYDLLLQRLADDPLPEDEQIDKVRRRYRNLVTRWEQTDSDEILEMYLSALAGCYDPHTSYMSPNTLEDFYISMSLRLEGIGARLRSDDGYTIVDAVLPGGAADRHGKLAVGDRIVGVDPDGDGNGLIDVVNMKLSKVVQLIRGPRGTEVILRVRPANTNKETNYQMTRDKIELTESEARGEIMVHGKKPDGTPYRIGYIDLPSFYSDMRPSESGNKEPKSSTRDVQRLIEKFLRTPGGIDSLILDLRSNGGGALKEAIDLVGMFIDRGPVVLVKSSGRPVRTYADDDPGVVYSGPLIVLVSKLSASASEIFAGAIQDYGRGIVVGDPHTHGKGTVQTMVDLESLLRLGTDRLGALKLTIQQFYRVNGGSTQNRGVEADIELPSLIGHMEIGEQYLPYALPFDDVGEFPLPEHTRQISQAIIRELQARSEQRRSKSEEFQTLAKEIVRLERRQKEKIIPLNEEKLRKEIRHQDKAKDAMRDNRPHGTTKSGSKQKQDDAIFERTYYNNEILAIMHDYLELLRTHA